MTNKSPPFQKQEVIINKAIPFTSVVKIYYFTLRVFQTT